MITVADLAERVKNPYREDEYFNLNVRSGILRGPTGTRLLAVPEELIEGLHKGLEDECGQAAPIVLYQCGKWWGKQFWKRQQVEVRHFFQEEMGELPFAFFLHVLRKVWALYGWGQIDFSFALKDKGFVEVRVAQAMYSDAVGNIGRTSDHIMAGVLASVVSELAGRELECVEVGCRSKGDQRCTFVLGMKARVDPIAAWVKQGVSVQDILARLASGEAN
jgi:predicted hydrocarbon binding protein